MKTYFASALLGTASAAAVDQYDLRLDHYLYKNRDYPYGYVGQYGYDNGFDPYGNDRFYSGPLYEAKPYIPKREPRNIDEPRKDSRLKKGEKNISTDDDRYSSSDSDSLSSSDYFTENTDDTNSCASQGDPFACKRVNDAAQCGAFETFNLDTCLYWLNEEVKCNALKPDGYNGKNGCPDDKPYISPIDNC